MRTTNQQTVSELTRCGRQWDEAIAENDVTNIARFMADEWVIIGTEGGITSKTNFLDHIRSGDLVHTGMEFEDIRVEIYGHSAVVTSKGTSRGMYKGKPFSYYEWSTNVYIQHGGDWRCVLTMLTPAQ